VFKWKKLGHIFNPQEINDGIDRPWMHEFSQCPSTLIFDNFVRVYFSCRPPKDANGQCISYTGFVDLDKKDLSRILKVSEKPVLPLGELGMFDEFAIYPTSVIRDKNEVLLYYAGWSRCKSVPFNTAVGLARSKDNGVSFERIGKGPILSYSLDEPVLISGPKIRRFNNKWWLFYLAGNQWEIYQDRPECTYKIRLATSDDGLNWQKLNRDIILSILEPNECQAGPDVFFYNGEYHMYFSYRFSLDFRDNKERGYRIGYAHSEDLINWIRDDENAGIKYSDSGWDSAMHHYPHVFELDSNYYMLYNGNEFGRYGFGLAKME
jgi:predicted GH43/DUF377 family glycosyl hydrolase